MLKAHCVLYAKDGGDYGMLFDTNIFIYANKGVVAAKERILNADSRAISTVSYMEYVPFCRNKKELLHQTVKVRDYKNESIREFMLDSDTN